MKSFFGKTAAAAMLIALLSFVAAFFAFAEGTDSEYYSPSAYTYDAESGTRFDVVLTGLGVYVRFTPVVGGEYWLESHSPYDTSCILLDEDYNLVYPGEDFDDAGDGSNFCFKCTLNAGETYNYLVQLPEEVRMLSLGFQLSLSMHQPEAGHVHEWVEEVVSEPSCTESGVIRIKCVCTMSSETEIPPLEHEGKETIVAATCTQKGSRTVVCERCGETAVYEIPSLGHEFKAEFVVDKNPTCTAAGSKSFHCIRCGLSQSGTSQAISSLGHDFGEWESLKPSTCVATGTNHRICKRCGAEETQTEPALGHRFSKTYYIDKPASCTADGSKSFHCSRCDARKSVTAIKATGHSFDEWKIIKTASCTKAGSRQRSCSKCSAKETVAVSALGHKYSEKYTVDKPASCTADGSKSFHCARCSAKKGVAVIKATGHSFGSWKIIKTASCTKAGSRQRSCTKCSVKETVAISALGHKYSEKYTVDKAATCTTAGSKSFHCARCDAKNGVTTIKATGHSFGKFKVTLKASCTSAGKKVRTCTVCRKNETKSIPKLGHDYSEKFTVDEKATPNRNGSKSCHCSRCDSVKNKTVIPKISNFRLSKDVYVFNGNAKKPSVSVKDSRGNAVSSKYYTVKYDKDCASIGKHNLTISFSGKMYGGSRKLTYKILPNNVDGVFAQTDGSKIKLKWNTVKGAGGYRIYLFNGATGKFEPFGLSSSNTFTVSLESGKTYVLAVKAFGKVSGKEYLSPEFSSVNCATSPKEVTLSLETVKGQVNLRWNPVQCSGYEIYMSKTRNGTYEKIKTVNDCNMNSFTKSGLKDGQIYYFQVRAFTKTGDLIVYSPFSNKIMCRYSK